jgi:hypothetical protein
VQPFKTRLLDTPAGILEWRCEAPAASVSIAAGLRAGEAPIHRVVGFGYAECLLLTVVPWALPISELRWGRWISPSTRRSIAWVDWRGSRPLTVVLLDGVPALDAHVDDDRIRVAGSELVLSGTETLHARALGDLLAGLGPIAACVPAAWRSVEDRKSRSVGTCRPCAPEPQLPEAGSSQPAAAETGWAIHETVRFP